MYSINWLVSGLTRLEFYAGVEVLGVFADDHDIDAKFTEVAADTRIVLAGTYAGKQPEFLAEIDIDAAETGAHGRRDGRFQVRTWCVVPIQWFHPGLAFPPFSMMSTPASLTSQ